MFFERVLYIFSFQATYQFFVQSSSVHSEKKGLSMVGQRENVSQHDQFRELTKTYSKIYQSNWQTFLKTVSWFFDYTRLFTFVQKKLLGFGLLYIARALANDSFIFNYCFLRKNLFSTFLLLWNCLQNLIWKLNKNGV